MADHLFDSTHILNVETWADVQARWPSLAVAAETQEAVFPAGSCEAARAAAVERLVQAFPRLSLAAARHIVALVSATA